MPTNRAPLRRRPRRPRLNPEAVRLYARACEILWEAHDAGEDGYADEEFRKLDRRLHQVLGRKVWQDSIFCYDTDEPAKNDNPEEWRQAKAALDALEGAVGGG
jgi:hypothetical protein